MKKLFYTFLETTNNFQFKLLLVMMLLFQSLTWGQNAFNFTCKDQFPSPIPSNYPIKISILNNNQLTNAISFTAGNVTLESNGIDTYEVYNYNLLIPYYSNNFVGTVKITTSSYATYNIPNQSGTITSLAKLEVNSILGTGNTYTSSTGLTVGTHNFNAKSKITSLTPQRVCSSRYFRVHVIKELTPSINLNFQGFCKLANGQSNQYSGSIGFRVNGTATNISSKLFLSVVNPAGLIYEIPLTSVAPFNNSAFYDGTNNGTYTIKLVHKFTNTNGSTVTRNVPVNEIGWQNFSFVKTFAMCSNIGPRPHKETGKSSTQDLTIEVENKSNVKNLKVFPNPTTGTINFEPSSEDIIVKQINVYDTTNLLLFSKEINSVGKHSIDLSNLKEGIYMLQIETDRGIELTKIVKNN